MLSVDHGIPDSDFFLIAQPYNGRLIGDYVRKGTTDDPYKILTLKDPKTGKTHRTEIHDLWRLKIDEDGNLITAWAKIAYGINGRQLVNTMKKRYPGFSNSLIIDFLLLKKL
jgi:hypothetical protein